MDRWCWVSNQLYRELKVAAHAAMRRGERPKVLCQLYSGHLQVSSALATSRACVKEIYIVLYLVKESG